MTLITCEALADPHQRKEDGDTYETDEAKIIEALAGREPRLFALVNLSEMFAPFLNTGSNTGSDGMLLVVGDTLSDRLLFWNSHHRFSRPSHGEITSLRIPVERLDDTAFLKSIRNLIERRGIRGHDGRNDTVTLASCSIDQATLETIASNLRTVGHWLAVRVEQSSDHAHCVPRLGNPRSIYFTRGGVFREPEAQASTEFRGNRVDVPKVTPWHMHEAPPPTGLRRGAWMIDLIVERLIDHCRYINRRHVWAFPRRLRLERAFAIDREPDRLWDIPGITRPMRTDALGLPFSMDVQRATLTTPEDDFQVFEMGVRADFEWLPFDRDRKEPPIGRPRFWNSEISDKGRHLLGILQLFLTKFLMPLRS